MTRAEFECDDKKTAETIILRNGSTWEYKKLVFFVLGPSQKTLKERDIHVTSEFK